MRRGRIFFYLAFILVLGLVAVAVIWFRFLQPAGEQPVVEATPTPIDLVNVVVVTQRVPRGNLVDETMLGMIPIPRDLVLQGYFTDLGQVVGRRARVDLEPNMILTSGAIVDTAEQLSTTGSNAALLIPKGMVAVSIPIDTLTSVSYAPQPGDHVNIIVSLMLVDLDTDFQSILPNNTAMVIGPGPLCLCEGGPSSVTASSQAPEGGAVRGRAEIDPLLEQTLYVIPSERQRPRLVSQSLLQDVIVLGVDVFPIKAEPTPVPTQPAEPGVEQPEVQQVEETPPEPSRSKVFTLIVTPQDAVTLAYLLNYRSPTSEGGAKLTLALRAAGDDTRVQTEAATLDFLLKQYNIPVPVKLPYGIEPRIDKLLLPEAPTATQTPVP